MSSEFSSTLISRRFFAIRIFSLISLTGSTADTAFEKIALAKPLNSSREKRSKSHPPCELFKIYNSNDLVSQPIDFTLYSLSVIVESSHDDTVGDQGCIDARFQKLEKNSIELQMYYASIRASSLKNEILELVELPFQYVLTVSELTREIRDILESRFPDIWVEGEISNLRIPPSGHIYFTLKDDFSQIRAVLFRMQARALRFIPEDGIHIICKGRVGLYEQRGDYQLILESIEPKGMGALQLAFLQLKERLEKEGFFDPAHKRPIPMLPRRIGIITSPTGAAIQDMIHILKRRFENLEILLFPTRVQGEGASLEICEAIRYFNGWTDVDVIIIGRGGGSLEDLWVFNEEAVARAIYQSNIPIISAVGHETDYTIADFVADLRAPTPSAAAELVIKDKQEVKYTVHHLSGRLENEMVQVLETYRTHLSHLIKIFREPKRKTEEYVLRVDDLVSKLRFLARWNLKRKREMVMHVKEGLVFRNPIQNLRNTRLSVSEQRKRLQRRIAYFFEMERQSVWALLGKLDSLSPLGILRRGYSITRKLPSWEMVTDAGQVKEGDRVEVKLHQGTLLCGIEKTERS